MSDLNARMIAAHAQDDTPGLIRLYTQAADEADSLDAACFFLTHAYVFALESGPPEASALRARLIAHDREQ